MSNALSLSAVAAVAATEPAGRANQQAMAPFLAGLVAAGLCVLAVMAVRYVARPRRLCLRATPGRPNDLNIVHVIALLATWLTINLLVGSLRPVRWQLIGWAAGQALWLAGCLAVAKLAFRLGIRAGLGLNLRHWLYDALRAVIAYMTILPVTVGLLILSEKALFWFLSAEKASRLVQEHPLLKTLPDLSGGWLAMPWLIGVVLAPLTEEVFFRGLLQSLLRRATGRPWPAILIASAFFACMHQSTPQAIPSLLALSIVLGYNYERTGRLLPSILIHVLFNGVFTAAEMVKLV